MAGVKKSKGENKTTEKGASTGQPPAAKLSSQEPAARPKAVTEKAVAEKAPAKKATVKEAAVVKKAAAKKAAVKKTVAKKASTKKAVAKKAVAKKAPAKKAAASKTLSEVERQQRIAEVAYLIAERRGFVGGSPQEDWLAAEAIVLAELEED